MTTREYTDINPVALVLGGRWTLVVFTGKDLRPCVQKISTTEKQFITKKEAAKIIAYPFVGDIETSTKATRYATKKGELAWMERN